MGQANSAGNAVEQPYAVSPHFTNLDFPDEVQIDNQIAVFADRIRGWQLDIAERLARNEPHSGFAVLSVILSYFELIAKYKEGFIGEGQSARFFLKGAREVLEPLLHGGVITDRHLQLIRKEARNGMYHGGITGPGIVLSGRAVSIETQSGTEVQAPVWPTSDGRIVVTPGVLVHWTQRHFSRYCADLLDPANSDLRSNFQVRFQSQTD